MNKYLDRYYHTDKDNNIDFISISIDCWEQMKYQALRNYDISFTDYNYIFCENINIEFLKQDNSYSIKKISNYLNNDLYQITKYKEKNNLSLIKKILENGEFVALRTKFNTLPPYNWFYETPHIEQLNHFCPIVGYNINEFYIGESPFLIKQEHSKKHHKNNTVDIVYENHLINSLNIYSDIRTIKINEEYLNDINKLDYLINIMIRDFYNQDKIIQDDASLKYFGKKALFEIKNNLENNNDILNIEFFKSHFEAHIISSRHKILYNCLNNDEKYLKKPEINNTLKSILKGFKKWEKLKLIILKNSLKKNENFLNDVILCLNEIIEIEDIIFKYLLKLTTL